MRSRPRPGSRCYVPLVYREALDLAAAHSGRGEPVFIATAALEEIAETIARELGLDGAIASRAEVREGAYTGRLERRLDGVAKAEAVEELSRANEIDLSESTAYSDSHSDLPFLEAVGHPVAVNPDRELRRVAAERGWPVRRFRAKAFPAR